MSRKVHDRIRATLTVALLLLGCGEATQEDPSNRDTGAADTASAGDSGGDGDTDTDVDADSDADADSSDTDGDSAAGTDVEGPSDPGSDTSDGTDSGHGQETDTGADTGSTAPCAHECLDHCRSIGGQEMPGACADPEQKCCDLGDDPEDTGGDADTGSDSGADTGADTATGSDDSDSADQPDEWVTIRNGGFWHDTAGNRIEAHGGGFLFDKGLWYWIGEDKSHDSGTFQAVNCYSSKNLQDWTFENAIITRRTHPDLTASDRIIERPKFVYNEVTQKYVMWLHWEGNSYADAEAGVFYSDTPCGDYTLHAHFRPNNNMSRDDTLFKDSDGTAYFLSAANENRDLAVYELTDDYLDIQRQITTLWPGGSREAPAVFKDDTGRYFLVSSGCTGWDPNQGQYASSMSMGSGWSDRASFGDGITYDTQPTYVIPFVGSETTTYIYAGDRWKDPDLGDSKYIWLPIKKNGTTLGIDYYDTWQLNIKTGEWRSYDEFIPQGDWKLLYVDSEETDDEDGRAVNAFDDMSSTYWHTDWQSGGGHAPMPHRIEIDLGAEWNISELRYLPRQDKDPNGTINEYRFYASLSPDEWGEPLLDSAFGTERSEKRVPFSQTRARYIRLDALSEINGNEFASIAELDLVGTLAR